MITNQAITMITNQAITMIIAEVEIIMTTVEAKTTTIIATITTNTITALTAMVAETEIITINNLQNRKKVLKKQVPSLFISRMYSELIVRLC